MNARKILLILGGVIIALVAAIIAVSLFTIQKVEQEKNRARTKPARDRRWPAKEETEVSNLTVTPGGIVEPKTDEPNESEGDDEKKD